MNVTDDATIAREMGWGLIVNLGGPTGTPSDQNVTAAWIDDGGAFITTFHGSKIGTWCDDFAADMGKMHGERARSLQQRYGVSGAPCVLFADVVNESDYAREFYDALYADDWATRAPMVCASELGDVQCVRAHKPK